MAGDAVQQRQGEAGRLAGAGLSAAQDVLARDDDRDGLALNGRRLGVAGVGDGLEQFGNEAEVGETQGRLCVEWGRQPTARLRNAKLYTPRKNLLATGASASSAGVAAGVYGLSA